MFIKQKKAAAVLTAAITAFTVFQDSAADVSAMFGSTLHDTENVEITIQTAKDRTKISSYIYGVNDSCSLADVDVTAVKQTGNSLSGYNWETNAANFGADGNYISSYELVTAFSKNVFSTPGLYTKNLLDKAELYDIPARYVTLQMMGYAANDAMGVVNPGEDRRWAEVRFNKADDLLIYPDVNDDAVYMDEYVSYLVNSVGFASDGGISGYFLDSEPETWSDRYEILDIDELTAAELVNKSSQLSKSVKSVDPSAMIFGPSVSGIEAYVNLKNEDDWKSYKETYSWFIDYYLDNMRMESDKNGKRLLDVLDLHFFTEAKSALLEPVISTDTKFANEERMQAVRVLWDSNYTENSTTARLYKQHTPIIPMLQASIRMYYPGTKLSFSEYNFGGGNDISGGIAQADVLGIFGREGVYMACLSPDGDDIPFQKAALNFYMDYDGEGSSFGDVSVYADNDGDVMSSVYASVESDDNSALRAVLINKNMTSEKTASVKISSDNEYYSAKVYSFGGESSDIVFDCMVEDIEENSFEFEMEPLTVYMFEFETEEMMIEETVATENTDEILTEEPVIDETEESVTEERITEIITVSETAETSLLTSEKEEASVTETSSEDSEASIVTEVPVVSEEQITGGDTTVTVPSEEITVRTETSASGSETAPHDGEEKPRVSMAVKTIVSLLVAAVVAVMVYVVITDFILAHKKK